MTMRHSIDPRDTDGGMTAAMTEKEAEESPSVDYEAMWWDAERRAEKAEDRADDAHNLIVALRADLAATEARAEQAEQERYEARKFATAEHVRATEAERERDEARATKSMHKARADEERARADAAESRPITVTDEMVKRAAKSRRGSGEWSHGVMRRILTAALTDPPQRPEGAEEIEALVEESLSGDYLSDAQVQDLADHLAERGVRVALSAARAARRDEEKR